MNQRLMSQAFVHGRRYWRGFAAAFAVLLVLVTQLQAGSNLGLPALSSCASFCSCEDEKQSGVVAFRSDALDGQTGYAAAESGRCVECEESARDGLPCDDCPDHCCGCSCLTGVTLAVAPFSFESRSVTPSVSLEARRQAESPPTGTRTEVFRPPRQLV